MLISGQRRADAAPYFFLSYAHTPRSDSSVPDPDLWVGQLYKDLCAHVLALTDLGADATVGFMDRDIRSGEGWSERLSDSLAGCRVFVPLFSPRYFASSMCGKEWYAFSQRAIQQHARSNRAAEAIVPALWVPVEPRRLPMAAERLQFNHTALGAAYATEGLYGLIKLSMFRGDYELAVYELAKRIVKVAENSGVEPGQPVDYRRIPSAFGTPRGTRSLRIAVAAGTRDRLPAGRSADFYGPHATDWNPFHPTSARPLPAVAADLARSFDYESTLVSLAEEPDPGNGHTPVVEGPEIMLVDRWTMDDPAWRRRLGRFDAARRPWTGVVVPWNRDDPESLDAEDRLASGLRETMPRGTGEGPPVCRSAAHGVHSIEALTDILPELVEWSAAQYVKHAPAYPPDGPRTERFRLLAGDPVDDDQEDSR
ncbi:TIR-like protein FxsC [Actinacidiphila alni]|uniref:TIR-like protein FxsC n=1 Tax=Actinacidiphila alni TaxID=380248 RepID=UPI0033F21F07